MKKEANAPKSSSSSCSARWTRAVNSSHKPILRVLHAISGMSARNPMRTIAIVLFLSVMLFGTGFMTNFYMEVDEHVLWTPVDSKPAQHRNWIQFQSGFPAEPRYFQMIFHQQGGDVLGKEQVRRVFQALDAVKELPRYNELCSDNPCSVHGIVDFWNESSSIFESQVKSDEDAIAALSKSEYPDGRSVPEKSVIGNSVTDESTGRLKSAQSFTVTIALPDTNETPDLESDALGVILDLDDSWQADPTTSLRAEVIAERSFSDEYTRAVVNDIILIPVVFFIMSAFTCIVFMKRHKVNSHSLLGLSAVIAVLLSIMSAYGLMFICGVPLTSITQILPFIIFGIGLDDSFVIHFAFDRSDRRKDPVDRVRDTIDDVGLSVTMTTMTSALAFALGCLSTIPVVNWLCLYAFPTIIIVFLYQLTFFVACIALDEKRVQSRRRDCCLCITVNDDASKEENEVRKDDRTGEHIVNKFMGWYAKQLLRPCIKALVALVFTALLIGCSLSATKLSEDFAFTDLVPEDSYLTDYISALNEYTARSGLVSYAYFRNIDQSSPTVQAQMEKYIKKLATIEAVQKSDQESEPELFWLYHFKIFVNSTTDLSYLDFNEQLEAFLLRPAYSELFMNDIVRDDEGNIVASRCRVNMDNVHLEDVGQQVQALKEQRAVTVAQPINADKEDWSFFTYSEVYNVWEFYAICVDELKFATFTGIAAVTGVAFCFIPHWSAALFVLPLISILYIDLLGVLQWAGASINPLTYVVLVMSIGLLVDFVMHILFRYYESHGNRKEKTVSTLRTMGCSILMGAMSTFLGILPLAFSTSEVFYKVFVAFMGLVSLGASHGLVLLPVILSLVGPKDDSIASTIQIEHKDTEGTDDGTGETDTTESNA